MAKRLRLLFATTLTMMLVLQSVMPASLAQDIQAEPPEPTVVAEESDASVNVDQPAGEAEVIVTEEPPAPEPVETEIPATEPVETEVPVTEPVETEVPVTEPVETEEPATEPVETEVPAEPEPTETEEPSAPATEEPVQLTPVAPQAPEIVDAVCEDGTLTPPQVVPATTEGVEYTLVGPDEAGSYTLTARLLEGFTWAENLQDWTIGADDVATYAKASVAIPECQPTAAARTAGPNSDSASYTIQKSVSPSIVAKNMDITYTIVVGWGSEMGDTPFVITDPVPADVSVTGSQCLTNPAISCEGGASGNNVVWNVNPNGYGNSSVTITVTAHVPDVAAGKTVTNEAFVGNAGSSIRSANTFTVLDKLPETVPTTPAQVDYSQSMCVDGAVTQPSLKLPENGNGVTYKIIFGEVGPGKSVIVQATLVPGFTWADAELPFGWAITGAETAQITIKFEKLAECKSATPKEIKPKASVCVAGEVQVPSIPQPSNGAGITYGQVQQQHNGNSITFTIEATLANGYSWSDSGSWPEGWTKTGPTTAKYTITLDKAKCTTVKPVDPTVESAVCKEGEYTAPKVTPGKTEGIDYTVSGPDGSGNFTVTATLKDGYAWPESLPGKWEKVNAKTAKYTGKVDLNKCEKVVPATPKIKQAVCDPTTGDVTKPELSFQDQPGVTYTWNADDVVNGGSVVVTATLDNEGYEWGEMNGWTKVSPTKAERTIKFEKATCKPGLSISKTSDKAEVSDAGIVITYTITVKNTGNVDQKNVVVADVLSGTAASASVAWVSPEGFSGTIAELKAGQEVVLTASYTVSQADVNKGGEIKNCASVTIGGEKFEDCTITKIKQNPGVKASKTTAVASVSEAGAVITYTIRVENTGNVALTNLPLNDVLTGTAAPSNVTWVSPEGFSGVIAQLPVGDAVEITASYAVTHDDLVKGGEIKNCISVPGDSTKGDDCATTIIKQVPGVKASKTTAVAAVSEAGAVITYTIEVENTGTQKLENVALNDVLTGTATEAAVTWVSPEGFDGTIASLAPGEKVTITASYTVRHDDLVNGGEIKNCITVANDTTEGDDCAKTVITQVPGVEASKTTAVASVSEAGTEIVYTIVVKNTGTQRLENVALNDVLTGTAIDADVTWVSPEGFEGTIAELSADEEVTITARYVVSQTDIDNGGEIKNCITVANDTTEGDDCATTTITQDPGVEASKTTAVASVNEAGTEIVYTIVVKNTGNTTLSDIELNDVLAGTAADADVTWVSPEGFDGTIATLGVGEEVTITASYAVSQEDLDNGGVIENCIAVPNDGTEGDDCVTTTLEQDPAVDLEKTGTFSAGDDDKVTIGDEIVYEFTVSNSGNTTLVNLVVNDPMPGLSWDGENTIASLAPGESATMTATYAITQADIDAGNVLNCAVVMDDLSEEGEPGVSDEDCFDTPLEQGPSVDLEKTGTLSTGDDDKVTVGDNITYKFTVTNTGNVTLRDLVVNDPMPGLSWNGENTIASLAPGESITLTATYAVTQDDLETGNVRNCAEVVTGESGPGDKDCVDTEVPYEPEPEPVDPTPVPTEPVDPGTPKPTEPVDPGTPKPTEKPSAPSKVSSLPSTGSGVSNSNGGVILATLAGMILAAGVLRNTVAKRS